MGQLDNIYESSKYLLPWTTFTIGLLGSLHCAGMCGGLVLSCSPKIKNNVTYQFGRLTSYSFLAMAAGSIGNYFAFSKSNPIASIVPAMAIGIFLIYLGIKLILKNKPGVNLPRFFTKLRGMMWKKALPRKGESVGIQTSYLIGFMSIFLPCGFLYGVILALATFNSPLLSLVSITTFWIGTLPVMSFAPGLIKRVLRPIYLRMPFVTSSFLILIGFLTIANRVAMAYQEVHSCH